ncbi:GNAT family N-acetyltransferase [Paenibacillus sp. TRM 82003]|nr:GNAT family N-acetyltransferase [Paenibacillus sp. TRM 82003]
MTPARAEAIASWRYPAPYERYAFEHWDALVAEGRQLADPELRERQFRCVLEADELCGFLQWFPLTAEEGPDLVRLGLGLRPDLCGQGRGAGFASFVAAETARLHPGRLIDLEVAASNRRAIRAYERAGFRVVDEYELALGRTYAMVWRPSET